MKRTLLHFIVAIILLIPGCKESDNSYFGYRMNQAEEAESYEDILTSEEFAETRDEVINAKIEAQIQKIDAIEDEVNEIINKVQQKGELYKVLGLRYLEIGMFGEAWEAYDKALEIYPLSARLHYYRGIAAGQMAKSEVNPEQYELWLDMAENDYTKAIELDPDYGSPLYSLALLALYEKEEYSRAADLLDRYLFMDGLSNQSTNLLDRRTDLRQDYRAMLVRGQLAVLEGELTNAKIWFGKVIENSGDEELVSSAREKLEALQ